MSPVGERNVSNWIKGGLTCIAVVTKIGQYIPHQTILDELPRLLGEEGEDVVLEGDLELRDDLVLRGLVELVVSQRWWFSMMNSLIRWWLSNY